MKYIIFFLFILFSLCCSPSAIKYNEVINQPEIVKKTIWIDIRFNQKEINEIESGISEWQYALAGTYNFSIIKNFDMQKDQISGYYYNWFILKKDASDIKARGIDKNGITLAYTDRLGGNIIVVINNRNAKLKGVIMHEIGHLLGIKHTNSGLMYPFYNNTECIDITTAEEVSNILYLDLNKIRYCY